MLHTVGKKGWIGMGARLELPKLSPAETHCWEVFHECERRSVGERFAVNTPASGVCSGWPTKGLELLPVSLPV